ncbi:TetR/AcrR family transcriptional regulator [Chitinophaga silvatica]|uniref:TetR/AcrR family transcriptional regulator n=1 Tax=Chitinophaga silvatica TaxID=2282649 RepID=A0A3E1Y3E8_9BACT|nr:TetR/AcrR family transcriptional regulator [Chitinophaga silvatica]RFS19219.1 TetR/AcrR family transcriptional regulator [Chitinophaga silvatica]
MVRKKEIHEQRVRGYFIDATKEILKSEGLKSVSVRNIADRAGYSFATLYNYFKDAKELVFHCVEDFRKECLDYATVKAAKQPAGTRHLKALFLAYLEYFVQYPGIYELFFKEALSDIDDNGNTTMLVVSLLPTLCEADWQHIAKQKELSRKEVETSKSALLLGSTGMLSLYLGRRYPSSYASFLKEAENFIDQQLK